MEKQYYQSDYEAINGKPNQFPLLHQIQHPTACDVAGNKCRHETNPTINAKAEMPVSSAAKSPPTRLKKASPSTGTKTIKKENLAIFSLLLPKRIPVAIVEPERESPGNTAHACANPIIKASRKEMSCFTLGRAASPSGGHSRQKSAKQPLPTGRCRQSTSRSRKCLPRNP